MFDRAVLIHKFAGNIHQIRLPLFRRQDNHELQREFVQFTAEHGLQNGAFAGMLDYRALEEIDKIFAFADQLLDGLHVFLNPLQPVLFNGQVDQDLA